MTVFGMGFDGFVVSCKTLCSGSLLSLSVKPFVVGSFGTAPNPESSTGDGSAS